MIGKTINNYKITHFIGKGGMGSVYLAKHITLDKLMAIKLLNPNLIGDSEIKERFISEAKIQAHLDGSKGIVDIYNFIEEEGQYYIFMEFVEGVSLKKYINNHGEIPENNVKAYFVKILKAMNEAHKKGVIHRDLKPSNIMITKGDSIKIMDFGIAKIMGEDLELTKAGTKIGSSRYMSPEQVKGEKIDYRSDIYSLGLLLYEMLVGKSPYKNETKSEYSIYNKILNHPLPKLQGKNSNSFLQKIINKATEKKKADRFQSIDEFLIAIETMSTNFTKVQKHTESRAKKNNNSMLIIAGSVFFSVVLIVGAYFLFFKSDSDLNKLPNKEEEKVKKLRKKQKAEAVYEEYLKKREKITNKLNNN